MELQTSWGEVIFAAEGAKTVLELVAAAVKAKKSLRGADLRCADLRCAVLRGADLRGADLRGADLRGADLRFADLSEAVLRGADLRGADLRCAVLSEAVLRGADLRGAVLLDGKIRTLRVFTGLYRYEVWAILFEDGSRWVRMGCLWKSLEDWEKVGIRNSNPSEFPNDESEACEERARAFEFAKDAALRMNLPAETPTTAA